MEETLWHCMAHYGIGRWAVEGRLWQWVIAIGRESQGSAGIISPVWEVPGVTLVRSRPEIVLVINVRQYLHICSLEKVEKFKFWSWLDVSHRKAGMFHYKYMLCSNLTLPWVWGWALWARVVRAGVMSRGA